MVRRTSVIVERAGQTRVLCVVACVVGTVVATGTDLRVVRRRVGDAVVAGGTIPARRFTS